LGFAMTHKWRIFFLLLVPLGCEKNPAHVAKKTEPATAPAVVATTEQSPAATKPSLSYMSINGRMVPFPLAKLRIDRKGSRVTALLFSDDPKDAINANYDGNSFYLEMVLDADEVDDFSTAMWTYKSRSSERQDSPYGIFLHGHKQQLQPMDVQALFEGGKVPTAVHVAGRFMSYTDVENAPPDFVMVDAKLPVEVIVKKD
jgi:hypothetical protein